MTSKIDANQIRPERVNQPVSDSLPKRVCEFAMVIFAACGSVAFGYGVIYWSYEAIVITGACLVGASVLRIFHITFWPDKSQKSSEEDQKIETPSTEVKVDEARPVGLKNEGTTCFINAAMQCLLVCSSYRQALKDAAEKAEKYYRPWQKFEDALSGRVVEWNDKDIKRVMICLVLYPRLKSSLLKRENHSSWWNWFYSDQVQLTEPFSNLLKKFDCAYAQNLKWPSVEGALPLWTEQLCHWKKCDRNFFSSEFTYYQKRQQALAVLLQKINGGNVSLEPLRAFVSEESSIFNQEDPSEFFIRLFNQIRAYKYPHLFPLVERHSVLFQYMTTDPVRQEKIADQRKEIKKERELEEGKSIIKGNEELATMIHLKIPKEPKTGQQLLNHWSHFNATPDVLEEDSQSSKWKSLTHYKNGSFYTGMEKYEIVSPLPQNLIIQLDRFDWSSSNGGIKNESEIQFEEELEIANQRYRLIAIVVHQGKTLKGGHYTALVCQDKKWWKCNDSVVSEIFLEDPAFKQGYLYFLEKVPVHTDSYRAMESEANSPPVCEGKCGFQNSKDRGENSQNLSELGLNAEESLLSSIESKKENNTVEKPALKAVDSDEPSAVGVSKTAGEEALQYLDTSNTQKESQGGRGKG